MPSNAAYCCSVETYTSHEGNLYCKPHFKSLFAPKVIEDDAPRKYAYFFIMNFVSSIFYQSMIVVCIFQNNEINCLGLWY